MSDLSEVSEKAVWLEKNLSRFIRIMPVSSIDYEADDMKWNCILSIILARLNPIGVEELFEYLYDGPDNFCDQVNLIHGEPGFTKKVRQAEKDLERLDIRPEMEDNPS